MNMKLRELQIKGFKSFDSVRGVNIPLGDITVLLGANGSGKSNLISFFHMLQAIGSMNLPQLVGKYGVNRLLFYGSKKTQSILFTLIFDKDDKRQKYTEQLSIKLPDGLFTAEKSIDNPTETEIKKAFFDARDRIDIYKFLAGIYCYQFNDTTDTARIKDRCYVDDAQTLRQDAGNLAARLKMLKEHDKYKKYYDRIIRHIRRVMPQFGDFDFNPVPGNDDYVRLNWREANYEDYLFDPHQLSDGSLRFMALACLLLQPPELLPNFIVLDEPELGLHPAALAELGGMVKIASAHTQVLMATQSPRLVDEFTPEQVIVAERDENSRSSIFKKLDSENLADWLASYSLSELWEKNVLGGQP